MKLTPRETQLRELLMTSSMRYKQIAHEMGVTDATIKVYTLRLYRKLGVSGRWELAVSRDQQNERANRMAELLVKREFGVSEKSAILRREMLSQGWSYNISSPMMGSLFVAIFVKRNAGSNSDSVRMFTGRAQGETEELAVDSAVAAALDCEEKYRV